MKVSRIFSRPSELFLVTLVPTLAWPRFAFVALSKIMQQPRRCENGIGKHWEFDDFETRACLKENSHVIFHPSRM
jgi:hypothetical protein